MTGGGDGGWENAQRCSRKILHKWIGFKIGLLGFNIAWYGFINGIFGFNNGHIGLIIGMRMGRGLDS